MSWAVKIAPALFLLGSPEESNKFLGEKVPGEFLSNLL